MKLKDDQGHFTKLSKVIGMISASVVVVIALGSTAFEIDDRYAHTIEVAGQFKAIGDSRQNDNLQNQLALTQIRLDILEDRLFREEQRPSPSAAYVQKLKSDIDKLRIQSDLLYELWIQQ